MCLAVAVAAWIAASADGGHRPTHSSADTQTVGPVPSSAPTRRRERLASGLNLAERVIDDPGSPPGLVARAALFEQLATGVLERLRAPERRRILALAGAPARASMRANLAASSALTTLAEHRTRLPPWRIIAPPPPGVLLHIFRAAQARSRVPWTYLAAIELVESRFGRIRGPSSAGAEGPMQFLPATWAQYGRGSINDPRAAIFAAARLLAANGAPGDMARALYHYNNSSAYVAAVRDYARQMQRDPRAYDGYYAWQVIYAYDHRTVLLPVGFPKVRPAPLGRGLPAFPR